MTQETESKDYESLYLKTLDELNRYRKWRFTEVIITTINAIVLGSLIAIIKILFID